MITERGTVKTSTRVDRRVQKELVGNNLTLGIVYMVLGGVLIALFIVDFIMAALLSGYEEAADSGVLLLILGIILLAIGAIVFKAYKTSVAASEKFDIVEEYEFFHGYLISREYVNGEKVAVAKIYYDRIVKIKETRSFLFVFNTRVNAIAVDKATLTPQELNVIYGLVRPNVAASQPAPAATTGGGEENAAASANPAIVDDPVADTDKKGKDDDPFSDF